MPTYIKPGFWFKTDNPTKLFGKGWLNLEMLTGDSPPVEALTYPVENIYSTSTDLFTDQVNQTFQYFQYVIDIDKYYEYLGTTNGNIADYRELTPEEITIINGKTLPPVENDYANVTTMYSEASQRKQKEGFIYRVNDTNDYYEYLGTRNNNISDYILITRGSANIDANAKNLYIGNAGATLTTATLLANRFTNVSASDIYNFEIDANNNISCYLDKDAIFASAAFRDSAIPGITYFIDIDGKVKDVVYAGANTFRDNDGGFVCIAPGWQRGEYNIWALSSGIELISVPSMVPIGREPTAVSNFLSCSFAASNGLYVNAANQTINAGGVDGDLSTASGQGATIKYSTNRIVPPAPLRIHFDSITSSGANLRAAFASSDLDVYSDALPVYHSNAIDWYLVFVDGVYDGKSATYEYTLAGLSPSTSYDITVLVVDEMGNPSNMSSKFVLTTIA